MYLLQMPYKIQLKKMQASYFLNKLEIPQNGQIFYSMNGNMDILRIFFFLMGWGLTLCFDRIVHKKFLFLALKRCMFSSEYYICGDIYCCSWADHLEWGKRIQ